MSGQDTNEGEPSLPGDRRPEEPTPPDAAPAERSGTPGLSVETGINEDGVLSVSAKDLELPTPVLADPAISPDAAAEASLEEAVSEAQSVEQEARKAGTLVGGRMPSDPAVSEGAKSDDAVAKKIEAAAAKAKAELANSQAANRAEDAQPEAQAIEPDGGDDIDKGEPTTDNGAEKSATGSRHQERTKADPKKSAETGDGDYTDDSVQESIGNEADYPSSPGTQEGPQEPVNEELPTDAKNPSENYPATPDGTGKSKPRRDKRDGPGAAKVSEPHERDNRDRDRDRRKGRRAVKAPPAPSRPPAPASGFPDSEQQYRPPQLETDGTSGAEDTGRYTRPPSSWQGPQYDLPPVSVRQRPKKSKAPLFIGLGIALALVLGLVLLIMALTSLLGNRSVEGQGSAEDDGVIAENVSPFDFQQGQCFIDFTDATQEATVVSCSAPHEAQLVNTFSYDENDAFPGEDELISRADELCRNTQLNDAAQDYELRQQTAYPQPESWTQGDRRVDCFIRVPDGGLTESLID